MKTIHPQEEELQQYAVEKIVKDSLLQHLHTCESCKAKVAAYQFIGNEIRQIARPAFEFDLAAEVLAVLQSKPVIPHTKWLDYLLGAASSIVLAIPFYFYRKDIASLLAGISSLILFTICVAAIMIVGFRLQELYQKYHRQMIALNELSTLQP